MFYKCYWYNSYSGTTGKTTKKKIRDILLCVAMYTLQRTRYDCMNNMHYWTNGMNHGMSALMMSYVTARFIFSFTNGAFHVAANLRPLTMGNHWKENLEIFRVGKMVEGSFIYYLHSRIIIIYLFIFHVNFHLCLCFNGGIGNGTHTHGAIECIHQKYYIILVILCTCWTPNGKHNEINKRCACVDNKQHTTMHSIRIPAFEWDAMKKIAATKNQKKNSIHR